MIRHFIFVGLALPVKGLAGRMPAAAVEGLLITLIGLTLVFSARRLRTTPIAIHIASIAAPTNHHLNATPCTQIETSRFHAFLRRWEDWTFCQKSVILKPPCDHGAWRCNGLIAKSVGRCTCLPCQLFLPQIDVQVIVLTITMQQQ